MVQVAGLTFLVENSSVWLPAVGALQYLVSFSEEWL